VTRRLALSVGLALAIILSAIAVDTASAQQTTATVTRVIDGDTLEAQLADGRLLTVRLIGIDTPEVGECGFTHSAAALRELVEGRPVNLVGDPTQGATDQFGRSLFYVDRVSDGLDAGKEMLQLGLAEQLIEPRYERMLAYTDAATDAAHAYSGLYRRCDGDFHRNVAKQRRELRRTAVAFMRTYYRLVSDERFLRAWRMLHRRVRRQIGPFYRWKAGYRRSLGVSVRSARARLSRGGGFVRAVVNVSLRSRDRDACSGQVVRQYFRGHWLLSPRPYSWEAVRVRMRKTGGGTVRLSKSECPSRDGGGGGGGGGGSPDCQGYSPCLPPGPDVDCAGGSGNGPRYVRGPVSVRGSDPYDLDGNGDGVGCET